MSKLNTVVFPAPFGPIKPVIVPVSTPKLHASTARNPPNRLHNPSIVSNVLPDQEKAESLSASGSVGQGSKEPTAASNHKHDEGSRRVSSHLRRSGPIHRIPRKHPSGRGSSCPYLFDLPAFRWSGMEIDIAHTGFAIAWMRR